jgi:hypothetical protein
MTENKHFIARSSLPPLPSLLPPVWTPAILLSKDNVFNDTFFIKGTPPLLRTPLSSTTPLDHPTMSNPVVTLSSESASVTHTPSSHPTTSNAIVTPLSATASDETIPTTSNAIVTPSSELATGYTVASRPAPACD